YQVVNDSGLDGWVYQGSVRLLIDPRLITSWGHFRSYEGDVKGKKDGGKVGEKVPVIQGIGFGLPSPEAKAKGKDTGIRPVGAEMEARGPTGRGAYQPRSPRYLAKRLYS